MRSTMKLLATIVANLVGVSFALATARFLAVDICLDRGGRIADRRLTCEFADGTEVVIGDYFGLLPLLLVLASGILTTYLTRLLLQRLSG